MVSLRTVWLMEIMDGLAMPQLLGATIVDFNEPLKPTNGPMAPVDRLGNC